MRECKFVHVTYELLFSRGNIFSNEIKFMVIFCFIVMKDKLSRSQYPCHFNGRNTSIVQCTRFLNSKYILCVIMTYLIAINEPNGFFYPYQKLSFDSSTHSRLFQVSNLFIIVLLKSIVIEFINHYTRKNLPNTS